MGASTAPGSIPTHNIEFGPMAGTGNSTSHGSGTTERRNQHGLISKLSNFGRQRDDEVGRTTAMATTTTTTTTTTEESSMAPLPEMTFSKAEQDMEKRMTSVEH